MDLINLRSLNLTAEESEGLIKFSAQKRGITTKKLLSTIKLNLKRKNNKDLASKSQQKLIKSIKSQQKLAKTQLGLIKSQQKLTKQQTLSNTKKIRNHLYNIENNNNNSNNNNNNSNKLDNNNNNNNNNNDNDNNNNSNELDNNNNNSNELDNNIENSNNNNNDDDFIENIGDLFNIVNYESILIKTGFDNNNNLEYNYLEYRSGGNDSLNFEEYLNLIKPYLNDLINTYKDIGEWKIQLTAQINFHFTKTGFR